MPEITEDHIKTLFFSRPFLERTITLFIIKYKFNYKHLSMFFMMLHTGILFYCSKHNEKRVKSYNRVEQYFAHQALLAQLKAMERTHLYGFCQLSDLDECKNTPVTREEGIFIGMAKRIDQLEICDIASTKELYNQHYGRFFHFCYHFLPLKVFNYLCRLVGKPILLSINYMGGDDSFSILLSSNKKIAGEAISTFCDNKRRQFHTENRSKSFGTYTSVTLPYQPDKPFYANANIAMSCLSFLKSNKKKGKNYCCLQPTGLLHNNSFSENETLVFTGETLSLHACFRKVIPVPLLTYPFFLFLYYCLLGARGKFDNFFIQGSVVFITNTLLVMLSNRHAAISTSESNRCKKYYAFTKSIKCQSSSGEQQYAFGTLFDLDRCKQTLDKESGYSKVDLRILFFTLILRTAINNEQRKHLGLCYNLQAFFSRSTLNFLNDKTLKISVLMGGDEVFLLVRSNDLHFANEVNCRIYQDVRNKHARIKGDTYTSISMPYNLEKSHAENSLGYSQSLQRYKQMERGKDYRQEQFFDKNDRSSTFQTQPVRTAFRN